MNQSDMIIFVLLFAFTWFWLIAVYFKLNDLNKTLDQRLPTKEEP